jgi:uncharacterized delta-60 repeat protein
LNLSETAESTQRNQSSFAAPRQKGNVEMKTQIIKICACLLIAAAALLGGASAPAAPGDLDTTFNGTGKVTTDFSGGYDVGTSVAVQNDGKIVVAGATDLNSEFALVRYNPDGSLDTSFNGTGKVTIDFGDGYENASSLAVQSNGKIVVAGVAAGGGNGDFALVRFNTDGSLDTSFNGNGKVTTDIAGGNDSGESVAVQSDGKIVVAGYSNGGGNSDFALVRYNVNGSLDTSWNGTGKVTTDIGGGEDIGFSVAVQSDGKIVASGFSYSGGGFGFAVVRYNVNGSLDTTFNLTGKVTTAINTYSSGQSVAVQGDGKIVVAGYSNAGGASDISVARYNADGSLDTGFGGTGVVTHDFGVHDGAQGMKCRAMGELWSRDGPTAAAPSTSCWCATTPTGAWTRALAGPALSSPTSEVTISPSEWRYRATGRSSS